MGEAQVTRYREAFRTAEDATNRVYEFIRSIHRIAETLRDWPRVQISIAGVKTLPPECTLLIDANTWPSAEDLGHILSAWHRMKRDVQDAWADLSADEQRTLKPPWSVIKPGPPA
jgi:hypothetical protein